MCCQLQEVELTARWGGALVKTTRSLRTLGSILLKDDLKLTPSPSFMKSFLQMCAMMPVAKASPITLTMVRNLSLE